MKATKETTVEILQAARDLISDPVKWTQGYYAKDAQGSDVEATSKFAVCFCAMGALEKVNHERENRVSFLQMYRPTGPVGRLTAALDPKWRVNKLGASHKPIPAFNDTSTHEEVLQLFDKAIQLAQESQD